MSENNNNNNNKGLEIRPQLLNSAAPSIALFKCHTPKLATHNLRYDSI